MFLESCLKFRKIGQFVGLRAQRSLGDVEPPIVGGMWVDTRTSHFEISKRLFRIK